MLQGVVGETGPNTADVPLTAGQRVPDESWKRLAQLINFLADLTVMPSTVYEQYAKKSCPSDLHATHWDSVPVR